MHKYIDLNDKKDVSELKDVSHLIADGGVVIFPTDTIYGIGTNGLNENAIKRIYSIKKRPFSNPISLLVDGIDMINSVAKDITDLEYALIEAFFPGPLTLVLKKKSYVPDVLTANSNTVGVRMPANDISLNLIRYSGCPIATSSANLSGGANCISLDDIFPFFKDNVDCFIDGGICKSDVPSTVVQVVNGSPHILRCGAISEKQILDVILEKSSKKQQSV